MFTVLAATGDETLAKRLYESLEDGGYHCFPAQDGEKVYFLLDNFHIDLLVCEAAATVNFCISAAISRSLLNSTSDRT